MADAPGERSPSLSVYDHSDKSIRHASIAALAYAGLRCLSAIIGGLQQPAMALWFMIDFAAAAGVLGFLAYGIHRRSRIAVVLAILYVVGTQFYVWFAIGSASGTIISAIVTGFLLRGAKRIFELHRDNTEPASAEN